MWLPQQTLRQYFDPSFHILCGTFPLEGVRCEGIVKFNKLDSWQEETETFGLRKGRSDCFEAREPSQIHAAESLCQIGCDRLS